MQSKQRESWGIRVEGEKGKSMCKRSGGIEKLRRERAVS